MARLDKQFESATAEWPTPQAFFDALNSEFGFVLDVAATPENAKCEKFFAKSDDALSQKWSGICWMNPPYGRDLQKWVRKAADEAKDGSTVVCLIPARTNTRWFHDVCLARGEVRFIRGRPKFGDADEGLPWPMVVVIFRPPRQGCVHQYPTLNAA